MTQVVNRAPLCAFGWGDEPRFALYFIYGTHVSSSRPVGLGEQISLKFPPLFVSQRSGFLDSARLVDGSSAWQINGQPRR